MPPLRPCFAKFCRALRFPAVLLLTFFLLGTAPAYRPTPATETAQAINAFTFDFLRQVPPELFEKNTVLSPQSIFHNYAMSFVGSAGKTREELAQAFHFPPDENLLLTQLTAIRAQVKNDPTAQSTLLNAVWIGGRTEFKQDYKNRLTGNFGAALFDDTFGNPQRSSDVINRWIHDHTAGRVNDVVSSDDLQSERPTPNVVLHPALVLVNVAYFKSEWAARFSSEATTPQPFHLSPAESQPVPMMAQIHHFDYAEDTDFQYVELPYKEGTFSLGVLLPRKNISIPSLLKKIDADRLATLRENAFTHEVDLLLPKFEMRTTLELPEPLKALGIASAFDQEKADFSPMFNRTYEAANLFIRHSRQQAWIKTDEEGTEAAAATTTTHFSIGCSSMDMQPPPAIFHADHPFAVFLLHRPSQTILFTGWYVSPER